jgi:hypothetical protein
MHRPMVNLQQTLPHLLPQQMSLQHQSQPRRLILRGLHQLTMLVYQTTKSSAAVCRSRRLPQLATMTLVSRAQRSTPTSYAHVMWPEMCQLILLQLATTTLAPAPVPTLSFSASSSTITSGQSSTLTWSSTNATSCTASNGWTGSKPINGSQAVSPTATTTYTLTCAGAGGNMAQSVTIAVIPLSGGTNYSIFTTQTPAVLNKTDGATTNYELGTKFQSSVLLGRSARSASTKLLTKQARTPAASGAALVRSSHRLSSLTRLLRVGKPRNSRYLSQFLLTRPTSLR